MFKLLFFLSFVLLSTSISIPAISAAEPPPPIAPQIPHTLEAHGDQRQDPYFWLRDKSNPKVLEYLKAENQYFEKKMKAQKNLREALYKEMKARLKQDDLSVPEKRGEYFYYQANKKGLEYAIHYRKKTDGKEEVLLDENVLAKGKKNLTVADPVVSDDGRWMAYGTDFTGSGIYTLHIKDLQTGKMLPDQIPQSSGNFVWDANGKNLFYVQALPPDLRSDKVYRHAIGNSEDTLVYTEADKKYSVEVARSRTRKFLQIISFSADESEVRLIPADTPTVEPKLFAARETKVEYMVQETDDAFYIATTWKAENLRLMKTPLDKTSKENWQEVIAHRPDVMIWGFLVFPEHIALRETVNGLSKIRIVDLQGKNGFEVPMKDPAYNAWITGNSEFNANFLRFHYSSLTTPESVIDIDLKTTKQTIQKQEEVLGSFKSDNYISQRLFAKATDGTQVPISIVHRRDKPLTAKTPILVYAYGAYGYSTPPTFDSNRLSLLDRGFAYAIAHVRGGSDMGRGWYLHGKMLEKKNTFNDFIACVQHLHQQNISSPQHTYATGESAGGLLLGAVLNMRPDLFKGMVVHVPFVDALTDMLDSTLPLTTGEYLEWGNPASKEYYDYIKSYSPYDNVQKQAYPALLITAGLNDAQVFYWEPAKWTAKLRSAKTDNNILLLKTEMEAGHQGLSGRYQLLKDTALDYAFLLSLEGLQK